jgi:hypothetical protein
MNFAVGPSVQGIPQPDVLNTFFWRRAPELQRKLRRYLCRWIAERTKVSIPTLLSAPGPVGSHGPRRNADAEFQPELVGDALFAPSRIIANHLPDELTERKHKDADALDGVQRALRNIGLCPRCVPGPKANRIKFTTVATHS